MPSADGYTLRTNGSLACAVFAVANARPAAGLGAIAQLGEH